MCKLTHESLVILAPVIFVRELNSLSDEVIFKLNHGIKIKSLHAKYQYNSKFSSWIKMWILAWISTAFKFTYIQGRIEFCIRLNLKVCLEFLQPLIHFELWLLEMILMEKIDLLLFLYNEIKHNPGE